jgi:parallel beta-helix repeat protein
VNRSVQFTGSLLGDGGTPEYTWLWDFGDGTTSEERNSSHQYNHAGVYLVTLTVTDNQNYNDTAFTSALIAKGIIADAYASSEWTIHLPLQFTGSASGGFTPYTYHWDFGDGNTSEEQNPIKTYYAVGNYSVSLTVTDGYDDISANTTRVTIKPFLVDIHGPYSGYVNQSVQFTGSLIGDGGTPEYTWLWDFGDGTTSEEQNPLKNYTQIGHYVVNVTVTDSQLNTATDTTIATISPIIYVDNDFNETTPGWGVDHFNTIQDGIDAASPGSAIYVFRGTYNETINISKFLSLIGEDPDHTIIDGKYQGNVVVITADEVTITGFTIKGGSFDSSGIDSRSNYTAIFGNCIKNNGCGIQLYSYGNNIINNTIRSNTLLGVYATSTSSNNRIFHNNFISNYFNALDDSVNLWDSGYPGGGNYWDDHPTFVDEFSGPYQTLPGSDGIIDTSYVFEDAEDRYPFMEPDGWDSVCPVLSSVLLSSGGLVTCPAGDGPAYQYITVMVNDFDDEPIPDVPAEEFLFSVNPTNDTQWYGTFGCTFTPIDSETNTNGMIRFEVKGETSIIGNIMIQATVMGYQFQDTDVLSCKSMDYDVNGKVGLGDFVLFGQDYGGTSWRSDFTGDSRVSLSDFVMFAQHYGHHG